MTYNIMTRFTKQIWKNKLTQENYFPLNQIKVYLLSNFAIHSVETIHDVFWTIHALDIRQSEADNNMYMQWRE